MQAHAQYVAVVAAAWAAAFGVEPSFRAGDNIRVARRSLIGPHHVPICLRGKSGSVEAVIEPAGVDNGKEGCGRNAGSTPHYYRIAIPMTEIFSGYAGSRMDVLCIELHETLLERI